jgi:hypothetical protein
MYRMLHKIRQQQKQNIRFHKETWRTHGKPRAEGLQYPFFAPKLLHEGIYYDDTKPNYNPNLRVVVTPTQDIIPSVGG